MISIFGLKFSVRHSFVKFQLKFNIALKIKILSKNNLSGFGGTGNVVGKIVNLLDLELQGYEAAIMKLLWNFFEIQDFRPTL